MKDTARISLEDFKKLEKAGILFTKNAIIGKWIREKIGASDGQFVTKEMLERYGATSVVFKKYENDIYVLEFEPFKTSQENEA